MNGRYWPFTLMVLLAASCAHTRAPVSLPQAADTIAVLPPADLTGEDQLVAGGTLLEKYAFHTEKVTVSDVIAAEARWQLAAKGYTVVAPPAADAAAGTQRPASVSEAAALAAGLHLQGSVLYLEIRRWEPNGHFHPDFVIVSISATLIDSSTGNLLWTADHPSEPVPTPGVVNPGQAYVIAATKVVQELLAGLGSVRAAPEPTHP
jgi:hypothetical protein